MEEEKKKLIYVVTMFKLEGHSTWRMKGGTSVTGNQYYLKHNIGKNKVTDQKHYEISRWTGEIKEL